MNLKTLAILIAVSAFTVLTFQNCAPTRFELTEQGAFSSLGVLATYEDVPAQMQIQSAVLNPKYSIRQTSGSLRTEHGVVSNFSENGSFLYTPDSNYYGKDKFTFEVRGDNNAYFQKDADILIEPVNDLPVVADTQLLIELNKPLVFSLAKISATDVDQDALNLLMIDANNQSIDTKSGDWGTLKYLRTDQGQRFYEFQTQSLGAHTHKFMIDDGHGGKVTFNIIFTAENPLLAFKPALAIRNMACLNCHANIKGNIITDYRASQGQQVSLHGPSVGAGDFLYGNWDWRGKPFVALNLHQGTYFVPKRTFVTSSQTAITAALTEGRDTKLISLPGWGGSTSAADTTAFDSSINVAASTIAEYINAAVNHRTTGYFNELLNDAAFPKFTTFPQDTKVREVQDVKIGSVTADQMKSVFGATMKYIRQGDDGYALKNFSQSGQTFINNPDQWMECDGDIYVPGTVLLKNLKLKSKYGCRIHATGTVFVQAAVNETIGRQGIDYDNAKAHLQIMSSKAVLLGLGDCSKKDALHGDTVEHRIADERTNTPKLEELGVVADYDRFLGADGEHTIRDASNCEGNYTDKRRNVAFSKLLLNAPVIHSRYTGNFSGVIIADHMVGSLGKFAYEYDPVFTSAPIFPLIPSDWFFQVKDCASYNLQTGQMTSDQSVAVANEPRLRKCQ